jgi:cyclopropane-fatty-acyl-phospholipid synthase
VDLAERIGESSTIRRLSKLARIIPHRHTPRQDAADISYHYDVGNDFYRLWLDDHMIYSCGYFQSHPEDRVESLEGVRGKRNGIC